MTKSNANTIMERSVQCSPKKTIEGAREFNMMFLVAVLILVLSCQVAITVTRMCRLFSDLSLPLHFLFSPSLPPSHTYTHAEVHYYSNITQRPLNDQPAQILNCVLRYRTTFHLLEKKLNKRVKFFLKNCYFQCISIFNVN